MIGRLVALGLALLAGGTIAADAGAQGKRKVAMILPGTIQDADFNTLGYVALQDVGKSLGVEVSHSENVAVADAERVSREYIASGHDVVAYHGGQFITIMQKLSAQFPKVVFIQEASGRVPNTAANVWIIGRKYYQGYYALGALAALATKTNKVGLVGGVRIPDVISSTNAVLMAMKEHNAKAQLISSFIGDFNDPVKARQTAEAQLAAGADFLVTFVNLGVYGVAEAVKASPKGALITTLYTEKWDSAPRHMSVSLLFDFAKPYREVVGRILRGEHAGYYEMRPGSGIELSEIRHVSPETATRVKALFREIAGGKTLPEITDRIVTP
jgi:basic membrane lipoprotein Med (substrate-binding protein (PBP1-ABC) superfamily)